jgi:hypothetical protein
MTELSSGEIKLMFKRIDEKLDDHTGVHGEIMQALKELDEKLEKKLAEQSLWIGFAKGSIAIFIMFVLPIMFWTVTQVVNMDRKIVEALDGYELDIAN